jgi:hypothetical protein
VDLVVDKLEKQIKRHRQKQRSRGGKSGLSSLRETPGDEDGESPRPRPSPDTGGGHGAAGPLAGKNVLDLPLVAMDMDSALEKIERSSLPYLVFLDRADGGVRLLRYTGGGNLELVRFHRQAD